MIASHPTTEMRTSCLHCGYGFGDPEYISDVPFTLRFTVWLDEVKRHLRDRHAIFLVPDVPVNVHLLFEYR